MESEDLKNLVRDYKKGYLKKNTLTKAIANRSDQAGLNALDAAIEWMVIIVGVGIFTIYSFPKSPETKPEPNSSEPNITLTPGKFTRPTALAPISSPFGMRFHPVHKFSRMHAGIDIAIPTGTPILAPADGTISTAGWAGECGIKIQIQHGQGWDTRFCHNSKALVAIGQKVRRGEAIALSGNTGGYSTGPHLHFEIRKNGEPQNPLNYVNYQK
ncbi:MAG: M23 family metallopeptidase [Microcoleaceae cyanobacterium]